jgi:hypothetical protein
MTIKNLEALRDRTYQLEFHYYDPDGQVDTRTRDKGSLG